MRQPGARGTLCHPVEEVLDLSRCPTPARGQQGLWSLPPAVLAAVRAASAPRQGRPVSKTLKCGRCARVKRREDFAKITRSWTTCKKCANTGQLLKCYRCEKLKERNEFTKQAATTRGRKACTACRNR